jgi:hypothetical protein
VAALCNEHPADGVRDMIVRNLTCVTSAAKADFKRPRCGRAEAPALQKRKGPPRYSRRPLLEQKLIEQWSVLKR